MSQYDNPLVAFSDAMAEAVARAGAATVLVDARRRHPASGIAISSELVLTADHVVERDEEIHIMLPDGSEKTASLTGRDPGSDLALLRLQDVKLTSAVQSKDEARVGQLVLALGRPSPEGIQASLGVVSALGGPVRTGRGGMLERYLRTDTIPYPGFSGGPLVDASGEILGINTSGLWQGGSLTIPAGLAWSIANVLDKDGRVKRGFLGVRSQTVALQAAQRQALGRAQTSGLLLIGVEENSPADKGSLLVGDILVSLGGQPVSDPDDLAIMLVGDLVGTATPVQVLRGGQVQSVEVIIGEHR